MKTELTYGIVFALLLAALAVWGGYLLVHKERNFGPYPEKVRDAPEWGGPPPEVLPRPQPEAGP